MDIKECDKMLQKIVDKYDAKDLDTSHIDFSDIEHIISDNFITRGSIFKNSSFDDTNSSFDHTSILDKDN